MIIQIIIDALKTNIGNISVANGYNTNVGANVFEWREYPTDSTNYPCAIIRDTENSVDQNETHLDRHTLQIEVEVITEGAGCESALRQVEGDVYKAIGVDEYLGGVCDDARWVSQARNKIHGERQTMASIITLECSYTTKKWDYTTRGL